MLIKAIVNLNKNILQLTSGSFLSEIRDDPSQHPFSHTVPFQPKVKMTEMQIYTSHIVPTGKKYSET